ncbi:m-AAA protease-interacting protein 1, mitochondrial-like [Liolophura sinensis]|uniref:m-AAA protease-interacting protein 1, mitochondrial-like n=1 Tax=Liolophura sinensis TaxID=3198878 RepID=UPI003158E29C
MAASIRKMTTVKSKLCLGVRVAPQLSGLKTPHSSSRYIWTLTPCIRNGRKYGTSVKQHLISVSGSSQQQQHNVIRSRMSGQLNSPGLGMSSRAISAWCCSGPTMTMSSVNFLSFYGCQTRNFSSDRDDQDEAPKPAGRRQMKLMDFQEIIWPSPLKSLRNQFFSLLIKSYFDRTFSLPGFLIGASQALEFVSSCISRGNFDDLEGLVTYEAIQEIQNNFADLNLEEKRKLSVKASDIFFKFVYEIGMIFDDDTNQRFVEITVVFQGFPGFEEVSQKSGPQYYEHVMENQKEVYVCNYRFIREFTKGVESDWTINKLNHFSPINVPVKW